MRDLLTQLLTHLHLELPPHLVNLLLLAVVITLGWGANQLVRVSLNGLWRGVKLHHQTGQLDELMIKRLSRRLAALTLPLLLVLIAPLLFADFPNLHRLITTFCALYLLLTVARLLTTLLSLAEQVLSRRASANRLPLRGITQAAKLVVALITLVMAVSVLFAKSPFYILSGVGALTAVILLIFKDALLGFVGGLQLAANDMVRNGDWIEMSKYGADGDVIEVGLTTVKVRNWDKTITTVPTYALVTDAFKNWRGMTEAGGRRVKRAVHIDIQSIRFLNDDDWVQLSQLRSLRPYLAQKKQELHNDAQQWDSEAAINRRRLTNIGTFRAYLEHYLAELPLVNRNMTLLVRQLPSQADGLPIEIYLFCRDTRWAVYEQFQADIFDHIFAMLPVFGLRAYQAPSGQDLQRVADNMRRNEQTTLA